MVKINRLSHSLPTHSLIIQSYNKCKLLFAQYSKRTWEYKFLRLVCKNKVFNIRQISLMNKLSFFMVFPCYKVIVTTLP